MLTKKHLDELTYNVLGAVIEVHKVMGPGLLEKIYRHCLEEEFKRKSIRFIREFPIAVHYKGKTLGVSYRCDFVIEECLILEIKSVHGFSPNDEAQLLNYMNLLKYPKGILINFNCTNIFYEGQKTYVNPYFDALPDE